MKTLIVLSAPPGSGKSTWSIKYAQEHENVKIVCSDAIRYEITNSMRNFDHQAEVWERFENLIKEYSKIDGVTVILDALCDLNRLRIKYVIENPEFDRYVLVLFPRTYEQCCASNLTRFDREDKVLPEDAMKMLYEKFEEPTEEALAYFDEVIEVPYEGPLSNQTKK